MYNDPLTEIFNALELRSLGGRALHFAPRSGVRFPAPHETPPESKLARHHPRFRRSPDGLFHALLYGRALLHIDGVSAPVALGAGDMVLVLQGRGHRFQDLPDAPTPMVWELLEGPARTPMGPLARDGKSWGLLGGALFAVNPTAHQVIRALPPVIHMSGGQQPSTLWRDELLRVLAEEGATDGPGSRAITDRVMHLLFLLAVRSHISALPASQRDRLGAFLDPEVGPALTLIHTRPEYPWTVTALAAESAMSRSAFASKFVECLGLPPLQYLTRHRVDEAKILLENSKHSLKEIAKMVGYISESAFSAAFRRLQGVTPGIYRRQATRKSASG